MGEQLGIKCENAQQEIIDNTGPIPVAGRVVRVGFGQRTNNDKQFLAGMAMLTSDAVGGKLPGMIGLKLKGWLGISFKYSDEASDLVQGTFRGVQDGGELAKEIVTVTQTGTFNDALKMPPSILGDLGNDAIERKGRR